MSSTPTYAIFGYTTYYPAGGFYDIYDFAETFQEALIIYDEALKKGSKPMRDWPTKDIIFNIDYDTRKETIQAIPRDGAHIVNLRTRKIVVDSRDADKIKNQK
jgi:hypothetical protein